MKHPPATVCLRPGCGRPIRSRGLCEVDYKTASKLVRDGKTTWAKLERSGKALPLSRGKTNHYSPTGWLLHP